MTRKPPALFAPAGEVVAVECVVAPLFWPGIYRTLSSGLSDIRRRRCECIRKGMSQPLPSAHRQAVCRPFHCLRKAHRPPLPILSRVHRGRRCIRGRGVRSARRACVPEGLFPLAAGRYRLAQSLDAVEISGARGPVDYNAFG